MEGVRGAGRLLDMVYGGIPSVVSEIHLTPEVEHAHPCCKPPEEFRTPTLDSKKLIGVQTYAYRPRIRELALSQLPSFLEPMFVAYCTLSSLHSWGLTSLPSTCMGALDYSGSDETYHCIRSIYVLK